MIKEESKSVSRRRLSSDDSRQTTKRIPLFKRLDLGLDDMILEEEEDKEVNYVHLILLVRCIQRKRRSGFL